MLLFLLLSTVVAFDCMDELGKPVDSWLAIKKPKGTSYFYYDSNTNFSLSLNSLNDTTRGALSYTIKQLWESDANYVIYNDQVPIYNINHATKFGHTKGFFAFDKTNGFWITHSIPLFPIGPIDTDKYIGIGSNAFTYAQNLLCLSISVDTLDSMAYMFQYNRPSIYDSKLTTDKYTNIKNLIDSHFFTVKLCESSIFTTKNGMNFKLYSKTAEWDNDLYAGCVTPTEKDILLVESWIRGSAEGPSCPISDYDTLDIKYLDFGIEGSWSETHDHSKWAITSNKNIICMGDINRMTTQYSRGGGTVCFANDYMHNVLKKAVTKTDSCIL